MTVRNWPLATFGITIFAIGIAVFFNARGIQGGFGYDAVGPAVFPMIIGGGFMVAAVMICLESLGVDADASDGDEKTNVWPVIVISAAVLIEALLIKKAGWVPMATVVFVAGAWAFGDRRLLLNTVFGLVLSGFILFAFNWGLGLDLPLGILAPILPANQ